MSGTPKNIFEKLLEVRKAAPYLQKDQDGYKFKYVSSSNTLGALRKKMDEMNLLLVPRILRIRVSDHETKSGGHEYFTEIWAHFTWVNAEKPEETVKCPWYGQGLDSGEIGVGKAATYAEKYFLLKFFNIATDKDDPDSFPKKDDNEKPQTEQPPLLMTQPQKKKIEALIGKAGFDREIFKGLLIEHNKIKSSLNDLTKVQATEMIDKWDEVAKWADRMLTKSATEPPSA